MDRRGPPSGALNPQLISERRHGWRTNASSTLTNDTPAIGGPLPCPATGPHPLQARRLRVLRSAVGIARRARLVPRRFRVRCRRAPRSPLHRVGGHRPREGPGMPLQSPAHSACRPPRRGRARPEVHMCPPHPWRLQAWVGLRVHDVGHRRHHRDAPRGEFSRVRDGLPVFRSSRATQRTRLSPLTWTPFATGRSDGRHTLVRAARDPTSACARCAASGLSTACRCTTESHTGAGVFTPTRRNEPVRNARP